MPSGRLFVISAPSGTGKSSLARGLIESVPGMVFSVSYTTRSLRPGEENGREYHFVDDATFDAMVESGDFLEWANVFGRRYGTGRSESERILATGRDLLLDIDVQGARQVRESGADAVFVFVLPPDYATLESRLVGRGSESPAQRNRRLARARKEAEEYPRYDYLIVNDRLDRSIDELRSIVLAERARIPQRAELARTVLQTFPTPDDAGEPR